MHVYISFGAEKEQGKQRSAYPVLISIQLGDDETRRQPFVASDGIGQLLVLWGQALAVTAPV